MYYAGQFNGDELSEVDRFEDKCDRDEFVNSYGNDDYDYCKSMSIRELRKLVSSERISDDSNWIEDDYYEKLIDY